MNAVLPESEQAAGDGIHASAAELIALQPRCKALFLPAGQPTRSALAGPHQSRFRGRGVDFLESRHYLPGDDIRNMDWRVTARTGRPHTKVFQEERERPVVVIVDRNPSMFFGTRKQLKSVQAAYLATTVAWIATQRGDRIGGVIFGNGVHHEIRPAGGRRGVMRLIQQLCRWCQPGENLQTDPMSETIARLRNVVRPGSLVVFISDFFCLDQDSGRHLSRLTQHNDVIGCQVLDAAEYRLPPGLYPVTDGEKNRLLNTRSRAGQKDFSQLAQTHRAEPKQLFQRYRGRWLTADTIDDPVEVLGRELRVLYGR